MSGHINIQISFLPKIMLECDADTYKALNSLADFKLYFSSLKSLSLCSDGEEKPNGILTCV